jgi:hypothetical protein
MHCMLDLFVKNKIFSFLFHKTYAYASRVEFPDGNYSLVPEVEEGGESGHRGAPG